MFYGMVWWLHRWRTVALGVCLLIFLMNRSARASVNELDDGYCNMYNLDFTTAHVNFGVWMKNHPEDPLGPVSDAAAFLFSEFDRLHIIDVQLFANQSRFDSRSKLTPDQNVRKSFEDRLNQASGVADAALKKN